MSRKRILAAGLSCLVLSFLVSVSLADVLHLKNGGKVEGIVTKKGDSYVVRFRGGTVTVKEAEVESVEKKESLLEKYEKKRAAIDPKDPSAHVTLGKWLREKGWETKAKEEFRAALALDPDCRPAHVALGHIYYEGAWRTEDEVMARKGFVKVGGKWVTKEEKARLDALAFRKKLAEKRREEVARIRHRLEKDLRRIAYGTAKECSRGFKDLVTFAQKRHDPKLEKFAGDVKAYFDDYWKLVRKQNALTEVRATVTKLKRPIPTLTTSLGAGSAPVTLQLPELSVWSVKTTVPIPAGR